MKGASTMSSAIAEADNYTQWVLSCFRPFFGKRILEVGTGQGNYKSFVGTVDRYVSVDLSEELVRRAQANDPQGEYCVCDIASPKTIEMVGAGDFDTILCTNVLEHVEDHIGALKNVYHILKDGGRLLLFVPAFPGLYSDMDRLAGHHRRYLKSDIAKLAATIGFETEKLEYFNPIGALGWWINKFKKYNDLDDSKINRQILIFDRYVLPFSRTLNPLTKSWWGQSLVVVLKKPSKIL